MAVKRKPRAKRHPTRSKAPKRATKKARTSTARAKKTKRSLRVDRSRHPRPHVPDAVYLRDPSRRVSRDTNESLRIGIDLGGTKTEGIIMDARGEILRRERVATPQAAGYDAILATVRDLVAALERSVGANGLRIGIGTPGSLSAQGLLKNSNTVCLNGHPLLHDLERRLARPVRITNDANCLAVSEAIDGAAAGYRTVFGVILGTGVGGGIVIDGHVHSGRSGLAGEWGHNALEPDGPPCYCGKHGCVETVLSGPGFARDYAQHGGDPTLDAKAIVARADSGDTIAEAALQRYLDRFGRALSVVINILDPDAIVLGGGLSNIDRLYREAPAHVARYIFSAQGATPAATVEDVPPILKNRFGDSSGVRGAAQLWGAVI